jgi:hypothetical protein
MIVYDVPSLSSDSSSRTAPYSSLAEEDHFLVQRRLRETEFVHELFFAKEKSIRM